MRRVKRIGLGSKTRAYLTKRQNKANQSLLTNNLDIESSWKTARQTNSIADVLITLQNMMGPRKRCMYCLDSFGCDIEHFRPKSIFPKRMFRWRNLLLCCTDCGRKKGNKFPTNGAKPLLIDPSKEEPWLYTDFDPITGNITARFDSSTNDFFVKGVITVDLLELDRREALAAGYRKTYKHIMDVIDDFLQHPTTSANLIPDLISADDHGLLGWIFKGTGQTTPQAVQLMGQHPAIWTQCLAAFQYY